MEKVSKQKVTLSIDPEVWEAFCELKWKTRKSISEMVENLMKLDLENRVPVTIVKEIKSPGQVRDEWGEMNKAEKLKKQEIKKPASIPKEEPKDMSLEERREWAYKQIRMKDGK